MGYIVDVYREKVAPEKNIAKLALFVSFFPQIIQGPISFMTSLLISFTSRIALTLRFKYGMELILWGFQKLIIADRAVVAINTVTADYAAYNGTTLTFTILLYALQLYADFSGGIDISRGVAQIFGIDMVDNFKRPYFAKSINDYCAGGILRLVRGLKLPFLSACNVKCFHQRKQEDEGHKIRLDKGRRTHCKGAPHKYCVADCVPRCGNLARSKLEVCCFRYGTAELL